MSWQAVIAYFLPWREVEVMVNTVGSVTEQSQIIIDRYRLSLGERFRGEGDAWSDAGFKR